MQSSISLCRKQRWEFRNVCAPHNKHKWTRFPWQHLSVYIFKWEHRAHMHAICICNFWWWLSKLWSRATSATQKLAHSVVKTLEHALRWWNLHLWLIDLKSNNFQLKCTSPPLWAIKPESFATPYITAVLACIYAAVIEFCFVFECFQIQRKHAMHEHIHPWLLN